MDTHVRLPGDHDDGSSVRGDLSSNDPFIPLKTAEKPLPVLSKKRKVAGRSLGFFSDFPDIAYTGGMRRAASNFATSNAGKTSSSKKKKAASSPKHQSLNPFLDGPPTPTPLMKPNNPTYSTRTKTSTAIKVATAPTTQPASTGPTVLQSLSKVEVLPILIPRRLPKPQPNRQPKSRRQQYAAAASNLQTSVEAKCHAGDDENDAEVSAMVKRAVSLGKQSGAAWLAFVDHGLKPSNTKTARPPKLWFEKSSSKKSPAGKRENKRSPKHAKKPLASNKSPPHSMYID